ncbi:MAG: hypothetical protein RL026_1445 [Pseudomonadota bacterium]
MIARRAGRAGLALGLAGLLCTALASTPGVTTRKDSVRQSPLANAKVVTVLPAGAKVTLTGRKGFWQQVESGGRNGWLKLASVRSLSGKADTAGLAALATGRGMTGNIVSSSGARALSAEDLLDATEDAQELALLESWNTPEAQVRQFAAEAPLAPRKLPYVTPSRARR